MSWNFIASIFVSWQFLACVVFFYQYGIVQIAIKKIGAGEGSRTRKLVWQYFFAASLALITAAVAGQLRLSWPAMTVAIIGAANAFGCYCHWRAYDISMARTAMQSNLDDLIAIGLGYAMLGELRVLTPILTAGVAISVISAVAFSKTKRLDDKLSGRLIYWVLSYSLIWGVALFSMRYFSVKEALSMPIFIAAWYVGSWLGALLIRFVIMGQNEAGLPLTHMQRAKVFILTVFIWTSLMLAYWMREFIPITIIQPAQLVAEMIIPAIIALVFFGEARNMSRKQILVIIGGLTGVALIAIGF